VSTTDNDKLIQILDAARKRFAHFGLAKATMTEIASDIGMSKASLYYYFPDKDALFSAVVEREMNAFLDKMHSMVDAKGTASEKLRHFSVERLTNFKELLNLVKIESSNYDTLKSSATALWEELLRKEIKLIEKILELGIRNKEFVVENVSMSAEMFVSVTRGLRMITIKQCGSYMINEEAYNSLRTHQEHFTQIFLKGISKNKQII
jgi:TetR/AcrR family transcriptional regulator